MNKQSLFPFIVGILAIAVIGMMAACQKDEPPTVKTHPVEEITATTVLAGGIILSPGTEPVTDRGVCWSSTNDQPTLNDNCQQNVGTANSFKVIIEGLTAETTYHLRAYAQNVVGVAYGQVESFVTDIDYETVTDIDGNEYRILEIGTQVWMIDNLRTTRFSNGDPIPLREANHYWTKETALNEPAYCWYQNDPSYGQPYGALYNFQAAADPRNICPTGWRVMDNEDLRELIMGYLGGSAGGGKLKATGTIEEQTGLWYAPNTEATNSSGFSAIPAGFRHSTTQGLGYRFAVWTQTPVGRSAIALGLAHDEKWARTYHFQQHYGFSIRCIKE